MEDYYPPRLSASQKSYQDDPEGFINRLAARADNLFEDGYRAFVTEEMHIFAVANSTGKEEKEYLINALTSACTCPFFTRQLQGEYLTDDETIIACKHVRGFPTLVRKTRRYLYQADMVQQYCALWAHWMTTQAVLRRRRCKSPTITRKEMEV